MMLLWEIVTLLFWKDSFGEMIHWKKVLNDLISENLLKKIWGKTKKEEFVYNMIKKSIIIGVNCGLINK